MREKKIRKGMVFEFMLKERGDTIQVIEKQRNIVQSVGSTKLERREWVFLSVSLDIMS